MFTGNMNALIEVMDLMAYLIEQGFSIEESEQIIRKGIPAVEAYLSKEEEI